MLQAENDNLRQKEERLLKRLSCLEEEMVKLKPVLLYQPFLATDSASSLENASAYLASLPYPAASGKEAASMRRAKLSRKKRLRVEEVDAATDRDGGDSFIIAEGSAADRKEDNFGVASRANPEIAVDSRADNGNASPRSHDFPESLFLEKDSPSIQVGVPADRVATRTEAPGTLLLRLPHTSTQVHSMPSQPLGAPSASAHRKSERLRLASAAHQDRGNKSVSETIAPPTPSSFSRFATPVTSDARTEHLLLAARMIGRKRAATAAGITDSERERELFDKAKDRKDKRKVARTPKSPASESVELEDKVKVKATSKRGSSYGKKTSTAATRTAKRLPMQSEVDYSAAGQGNPIQAQLSPQTALTRMDSLLSAASMMVSGAELSETTSGPTGGQILASGMGTRRPSSIFEDPEILPPAKRRRNGLLDDSDPQSARSALDVLADQAAVAESSSTNSVIRDTGRRGRTKSKGRKEGAENERYSRDAAIVTDSLEFNVNEVRQGSVSLAYSQNPGPRLISAPESFLSGRPDFRNSTSSNPSGEGF
ncbi:hypothetical protein GYMLUDRAFT_38938 [Collybiopsis luxurians FD-317 M1]|nr:hypothetical protein GYMLUDRAFT_38938 [Collybiopsis luxurians FD-317 M1]